jgi:tetratricopeptide (TPR) repeat protein
MSKEGSRPNRLLIAGITVALVGAILIASYLSQRERIENERLIEEAELALSEGIELFGRRQYQQSVETLRTIPEDAYQDWHVHYYLGSALINLRDFQSAAMELEKALGLNADEPSIMFALGVTYFKLGNLALSKAYFAKVVEVDPGNDDARGLLDIVASMERKQQMQERTESGPSEEGEEEDVVQPSEMIPPSDDETGSGN